MDYNEQSKMHKLCKERGKNNRHRKNAIAGTMESSDVYVEIEPADELNIQLESVVKQQFGDQIISAVRQGWKKTMWKSKCACG